MKIKSKRKAGETNSMNCGSETSPMGFAEAHLTETRNDAPSIVGLKTWDWAEKSADRNPDRDQKWRTKHSRTENTKLSRKISGEKSFGAFLRADRNQENHRGKWSTDWALEN
jgi:hypothetical protein